MNDIFDLVWVLFFIFWVSSIFKKIKGAGKKAGKVDNKKGILESFVSNLIGEEALEQFKKEMSPEKKMVQSGASINKVRPASGKKTIIDIKPTQYKGGPLGNKLADSIVSQSESEIMLKGEKKSLFTNDMDIYDMTDEDSVSPLSFSMKDIKQGIIMSEILLPPVSKRKH